MPSCARKDIINEDEVGVYHVWGRCVRQAWLCGKDPDTGRDYEHRRGWIHRQMELLARLFAVEIGFHAELRNHLHLILRNRPDVVETWSDEDVVRRMLTINKLTRNMEGELVEPTREEVEEDLANAERVAEYRKRLSSISWFMKALRENISLRANLEDKTTGAFWDGRFGCRSLQDEASILVCGIYVDLNQVYAGEAQTPEDSTHTSAYDRIMSMQAQETTEHGSLLHERSDGWLAELTLAQGLEASVQEGLCSKSGRRASDKGFLDIRLDHYLELLDWTGRQLRTDKSGAIPQHLAPILERLHIRKDYWLDAVTKFDRWFSVAVGSVESVRAATSRAGRRWCHGIQHCQQVFG